MYKAIALLIMISTIPCVAQEASAGPKPQIRKLGTIDCDLVEATPIVFKGKLYRFEYVRAGYKPNETGKSYFRFVDVKTGEPTASFAKDYHLGSAFAEGDTMYAYGVPEWGRSAIQVFSSDDLEHWTSATALEVPDWKIFNNSVCKGKDGYVMAFEVGEPVEIVGVAFTNFFAASTDLIHWKLMPLECVYAKERYTACPSIRYLDGMYYMIYLEARPGPSYVPHIVRTADLIKWESSPHNPMMEFGPEDKTIANPKLTEAERKRIEKALDRNNSDVDLCEFEGRVVIYYSWGNQEGNEFLAEAVHEGTLEQFLKGYFPSK